MHDPSGFYNTGKDFTYLAYWKKCRKEKPFFYQTILPAQPPDEKLNPGIQIRKGVGAYNQLFRKTISGFIFRKGIVLWISRRSLYELKEHLISCFNLKYTE